MTQEDFQTSHAQRQMSWEAMACQYQWQAMQLNPHPFIIGYCNQSAAAAPPPALAWAGAWPGLEPVQPWLAPPSAPPSALSVLSLGFSMF